MRPTIAKLLAFVVPLMGLVLVIAIGENTNDDICPGNLAMEKSREIVEGRPGVIETFWGERQWSAGCRVSMKGYADVESVRGVDRKPFEVVLAFDPQVRRWLQVSLAMPE